MRISKHLKPLALASGLLLCAPAIAVEEGDQAPAFTLPSIYADRGEISLADYAGKAVYIDFWASWCAPCLVSLPQYNELYQKYREQGLEILAINVDNPLEEGLFFLEDTPLDFPIPADPEGNALELFAVIGMPTSFLIGPDGNVELVHVGFREGDIAAIEEAIQRVLPSP